MRCPCMRTLLGTTVAIATARHGKIRGRARCAVMKLPVLSLLLMATTAHAGVHVTQAQTQDFILISNIPNDGGGRGADFVHAPNFGLRQTVQPKNQLVVFLPGNGTLTDKYNNFYTEAATQGYHVVALDFL